MQALEQKVKSPPGPSSPTEVDPVIGDWVRVRPGVVPKYDWGNASPGAIGRLTWFHEDRCVVDFPTHADWNGLLSEMERVSSTSVEAAAAMRVLLRVGDTVKLRENASEPVIGDWGDAASNETMRAAATDRTLVGEITAVGTAKDGSDLATVAFPNGARWVGSPSELEIHISHAGGVDEVEGKRAPWAHGGARSVGSGLPKPQRAPPIFSLLMDSRSPSRVLSSVPRLPGVPLSTWVGWALGAAFAQMSGRGGSAGPGAFRGRRDLHPAGAHRHGGSPGGLRRRRGQSSSALSGQLGDDAIGSEATDGAESDSGSYPPPTR